MSRNRMYRRRFNRRIRYNKRGQKVYVFKRFCALPAISVSNTLGYGGGFDFSLIDLPNYTEFTSLYDQYKLNAVKITFLPQMTENVSLGSVNNPQACSRFMSAIDYNDSSAPASQDDIRQYQTCKMTPVLKQHRRYIYKPKILDSSSTSRSPWMSTASPSTNYYGIKFYVEPFYSTTTTTMIYNVEAIYYLSFKQVK